MTPQDQTQDYRPASRPFTGRHMLLCMVAFFGVIIAVNLTMATLANLSWTGLIVKNSYVASQNFNDHLRAGRAQAALGWASTLTYDDARLTFALRDKSGALLKADSVRVEIGRPATETSDRTLALSAGDDGQFSAVQDLAPGQWDLRATARVGEQIYVRETRILVRR